MNGKKWSISLAILLLIQVVVVSQALSSESLLPQSRVSLSYSESCFKEIYESVCVGLFIYRLDAVERHSKEELIKYFSVLLRGSNIKFDLDNIDMKKRGWTRYYPFSIGDKQFIMRIFLTKELCYQQKAPVLYEGILTDPEVTFQVLPSVNEIIAGRRIEPFKIYSSRPSDSSS